MSQSVETSEGVSIRECARQLGISDTAIRKAIDAKRCSKLPNGKVLVEAIRQGMAETANPLRGGQRHRGVFGLPQTGSVVTGGAEAHGQGAVAPTAPSVSSSAPAATVPSPPQAADPIQPSAGQAPNHAPLLAARTLSEQTRAAREQIELQKLQGTVAEVDPMVRAVFDAMTTTHSALRSLPDRLTPLVTPETDAAKVYTIIEEEIQRIAAQLRDDLETKARAGQAVTA